MTSPFENLHVGSVVATAVKKDDELHRSFGKNIDSVALVHFFVQDGKKWAVGVPLESGVIGESRERLKMDPAAKGSGRFIEGKTSANHEAYTFIPLYDTAAAPFVTRDTRNGPTVEIARIDFHQATELGKKVRAAHASGIKPRVLGKPDITQAKVMSAPAPKTDVQSVPVKRALSVDDVYAIAKKKKDIVFDAIKAPSPAALTPVARAYGILSNQREESFARF